MLAPTRERTSGAVVAQRAVQHNALLHLLDLTATRSGEGPSIVPTRSGEGPSIVPVVRRPGGHCEGQYTRSHPELGRENPQRRWYSVLRRGRVGHRQVFQQPTTHPINSARQLRARARTAHRMLTACDLVRLITVTRLGRAQRALAAVTPPRRRGPSSRAHRGVEQPGSSSGS
jgi:hypothetical protein